MQPGSRVDFVTLKVYDIKMIFSHFLKTAQIFIANGMAFMEGRALEFTGTDFGNIMSHLGSHCIV